MKVILQRVTRASVSVDGAVVGAIQHGLLLLLGIALNDTEEQADWLAQKIATLRVFRSMDNSSHFDRSLTETAGAVLVISQFTLFGDVRKGRRPDFTQAAKPLVAAPLVDHFCNAVRSHGIHVETGIFGADMEVELVNDGPVTITLER